VVQFSFSFLNFSKEKAVMFKNSRLFLFKGGSYVVQFQVLLLVLFVFDVFFLYILENFIIICYYLFLFFIFYYFKNRSYL